MRRLTLISLVCAVAIPVAGCGDDDDDEGGSGSGSGGAQTTEGSGGGDSGDGGGGGKAQTLKLSADAGGALKFDKSSLSAKPGKVTIELENPSSLPHAVDIEGSGVEESSSTIGQGETTKVSATVKAGTYEYYCPVGDHQAAGMEGTLTVE